MKNDKVKIKVTGKNINRFIHRLHTNKIEIYDIKYYKNNTIFIIVKNINLDKIYKIKSIYLITIVKYYGYKKIILLVNRFKILIISIFISFLFLLLSMNIITNVEVIHSDSEIRKLLYEELEKHNITKFSFKKNYNQLEVISEKIVDSYKDKIEWLEIENIGTKYIVKVEERKLNIEEPEAKKVNIIAGKTGLIKRIDSSSGVVLKNTNSFVSKGDVVISGEVYLNDELKNITTAAGTVYAEVWYETSVEVPYIYYDEKVTGNKNEFYRINFLSNKIDLFTNNKYSSVDEVEEKIIYHNLLPINFSKVTANQTKITNEIYTISEAILVAKSKSSESIKNKLNKDEYIISSKELKVSVKDSKIVVDMFFSVYENITDYVEIDESKLITEQVEE